MRLLNRQLRALSLAGTVGLPAPFPAVGHLYLVLEEAEDLGDLEQDQDQVPVEGEGSGVPELGIGEETLVKIVHEVSPKITIVRYVRFTDISAIFVPDDPSKVDYAKGAWYLEKDLIGLALSCLFEASEAPTTRMRPRKST